MEDPRSLFLPLAVFKIICELLRLLLITYPFASFFFDTKLYNLQSLLNISNFHAIGSQWDIEACTECRIKFI